jgi:isopenicillin-N N-acyltransferase-like protein
MAGQGTLHEQHRPELEESLLVQGVIGGRVCGHRHYWVAIGDPGERGLEHGRLLAGEIQQTVELYLRYFATPEAEIVSMAEEYSRAVREYNVDYATEIEAIAEAADLPPWKIYALNARTEIINRKAPECTALYFARNRILGQNWDWLIEPGMLAKIGMNSCGLGVCLNILLQPHGGAGVPVHVVLRAVLDSMSIEQAKQEIMRSGNDKASHLLLGDARGGCFGMELAAEGVHELTPTNDLLVHTNHYLTPGIAEPDPQSTTRDRLAKAQTLGGDASDQSVGDMRRILLDMSDGERSINSTYRSRPDFDGMDAGTVATLVMDLPNKVIHVSQGNDPQREFTRLEL